MANDILMQFLDAGGEILLKKQDGEPVCIHQAFIGGKRFGKAWKFNSTKSLKKYFTMCCRMALKSLRKIKGEKNE